MYIQTNLLIVNMQQLIDLPIINLECLCANGAPALWVREVAKLYVIVY